MMILTHNIQSNIALGCDNDAKVYMVMYYENNVAMVMLPWCLLP